TPEEAGEVALAIGSILRATGKVKRGLGTIRQDLNISIPDGALIEIKGVQELEIVPLAVEYEIQRQLNLLKIREELKKAEVAEKDLQEELFDATEVFKQTKSKVIRKALDKNQKVLAVRLPKFKDFLKRELLPNFRLGTEMADRARFWGRVGGIFHTDEMPAYGISAEEVEQLRKLVNAQENDAIVFVADDVQNAEDALKAVVERARETMKGVPEETRTANPDGTTRYMRPRPGAARMYPETDIPQMRITEEQIERIRSHLPELLEQKLGRLVKECKLNEKLAKQILDSPYIELFEILLKESHVSPTAVAVFLTETLKSLKRDGMQVDKVSDGLIREMFKNVGAGKLMKESMSDVTIWLAKNEGKDIQEAINSLGLKAISEENLNAFVDKVVAENRKLIQERGEASFGILMGYIMKDLRGKVDAAQISKVLKEKMKKG
ncbi:MAG TPA: Glu-tRNA(Gln) amidotransferase subunit GatE, partial [Candidatus Bathyarchaeia archaeon]|nr:Glu-tRNA(Gln) amidotransferase subunit GatE [Candidatus Bathyarchaeia archaeon]